MERSGTASLRTARSEAPGPRSASTALLRPGGALPPAAPRYGEPWEIPGGAVEAEESPQAGARHEVLEEPGFDLAPGALLGVDWTAARSGRSDGVVMVFDGGRLSPEQVSAIRLRAEELRGYAFVDVGSVGERLVPVLARRVQA